MQASVRRRSAAPPAATDAVSGGGGGGSGGAVENRDLGRRMCIQDFQVGDDDDGTIVTFRAVGSPTFVFFVLLGLVWESIGTAVIVSEEAEENARIVFGLMLLRTTPTPPLFSCKCWQLL